MNSPISLAEIIPEIGCSSGLGIIVVMFACESSQKKFSPGTKSNEELDSEILKGTSSNAHS